MVNMSEKGKDFGQYIGNIFLFFLITKISALVLKVLHL